MDLGERYMRAALRLHTGRPCRDWTPEEALDSFVLLSPVSVSPDEWGQRLGLTPDSPTARKEPLPEPTPEEQARINAQALKDLITIPGVTVQHG